MAVNGGTAHFSIDSRAIGFGSVDLVLGIMSAFGSPDETKASDPADDFIVFDS